MLLFTHAACFEHQMQPGHPESPERLGAVLDLLKRSDLLNAIEVRQSSEVDAAHLALVHDPGYLRALEAAAPASGLVSVDPDTMMSPGTLPAARMAAGAMTGAVTAVLGGEAQRAFCAVRPPGHHAERDQAMGFCFYNNIAIGAALALHHPTVDRVAILDFDVHHGNGTVEIFRDRPEVLVCSSFQHPFYPGRYHDLERPNIVNTPLPAGTGSAGFRHAIERDWLPALETHAPQLILVSAGFDAHRSDPLAQLELVEDDFHWVTRVAVEAAGRSAGGRVVSTLEGGYDLPALARSAAAHLAALV